MKPKRQNRQGSRAEPGNDETFIKMIDGVPFHYARMQNVHGVWEEVAVHEFIAMTFLGYRRGSGQIVRHRNPNDTLNNAVDNLYVLDAPIARLNTPPVPPRKHAQPVFQYSLGPLRLVKMFDTLAQAERQTGIAKSKIKQACRGTAEQDRLVDGYYFCFESDFVEVVKVHGASMAEGESLMAFECLPSCADI
jgi:hypothetical protein